MNYINSKKIIVLVFCCLNLMSSSCQNRNGRNNQPVRPQAGAAKKVEKIDKVIFFLENSGSMFGYVKKANEFKNTLVSLAYLPEFDRSSKEFYFINGTSNSSKNSKISVSKIGNDPDLLNNSLNESSFKNQGDPKYSDLTKMFEKALGCVKEGVISILISDCIYDVGEELDPLTSLKIETEKTKKVFRDRLETENIETIIIKGESQFEGQYFFASKRGSQTLNKKRPYYILIFGDSKLLNKFFTEENISKIISGYKSLARFMKIDNINIPYQPTTENLIGSFRSTQYDKLTKVKVGIKGLGFQFSFAVDYSSLPFPDIYYQFQDNYKLTPNNYLLTSIEKSTKNIIGLPFTPTHLITMNSAKSPFGSLEIALKYKIPKWIDDTNIDSEDNIVNDLSHTWGFRYLIEAITEAYQYRSKEQNIATFKFEISKN